MPRFLPESPPCRYPLGQETYTRKYGDWMSHSRVSVCVTMMMVVVVVVVVVMTVV